MFRNGQKIGAYTIKEELGRGAFGVVWLAEENKDLVTRIVALKLVEIGRVDLEKLKEEPTAWAKVSGHPNVLTFIDANVFGNVVAISSQYVKQGTLRKWMDRNRSRVISMDDAITITRGILKGLDHIHSKGILHRDLKPENVLLDQGRPVIADFGLARVLKADIARTNSFASAPYMAPESWRGTWSGRSDLWAVGVILYELLTGRQPFVSVAIVDLLHQVESGTYPPLPDHVPDHVAQVVARALGVDPSERYATAKEMLSDLVPRLSSGGTAPAGEDRLPVGVFGDMVAEPTPSPEQRPERAGFPWAWAVTGAAVLVLAVTVAAFTLKKPTVVKNETDKPPPTKKSPPTPPGDKGTATGEKEKSSEKKDEKTQSPTPEPETNVPPLPATVPAELKGLTVACELIFPPGSKIRIPENQLNDIVLDYSLGKKSGRLTSAELDLNWKLTSADGQTRVFLVHKSNASPNSFGFGSDDQAIQVDGVGRTSYRFTPTPDASTQIKITFP